MRLSRCRAGGSARPVVRLSAIGLLVLLGLALAPVGAAAQERPSQDRPNLFALPRVFEAVPAEDPGAAPRVLPAAPAAGECAGCPKRRVGLAIAEVIGVNVLYNVVNRVIKPEEEKIYFQVNPSTWWDNLSYGFEWDDNTFQVNQFGHPYQGNNYFNAGRANGMSFWESAPLAALGSLTWEYFGERHKASLNDLVMTTLGGISLGEMFHRTGWLIRDTRKTGKGRFFNEFAAMVIDPVTGLNRFINGDARRVSAKPDEFVPTSLSASVDAGVLWRGEDTRVRQASGDAFAQINLGYGTMAVGRSNVPFDAFFLDLRLGGGNAISEAIVRGRLLGRQLSEGPEGPTARGNHFSVVMTYDYQNNTAFQYGGQGFSAVVHHRKPIGDTYTFAASGNGSIVVLGAMDSLYQKGEDRQYDFGPGFAYAASVAMLRKGLPFLRASYTGLWLHSIDGARVDHVTDALRVDVLAPIRGNLAFGSTAEFVRRKSYYDDLDDVDARFPQFRVYLSWLSR